MNKSDINNFLTNPELVANASSEELRRLIEVYPYCEALYWIYLRSLYVNDDAIFEDELMRYGLHISNRRLFYNYLTTEFTSVANTPDENISQLSTLTSQLAAPDYFALEQNTAQKQSLQQLAAQLKVARLARQKNITENNKETRDNQPTKVATTKKKTETKEALITEDNAKRLIKEQKYLEAIEILRAISLNNPKKSANFALQIKFLETIINNHNKK